MLLLLLLLQDAVDCCGTVIIKHHMVVVSVTQAWARATDLRNYLPCCGCWARSGYQDVDIVDIVDIHNSSTLLVAGSGVL